MKKSYPIVVTLLLCSQFLMAQQLQNNSLLLGNQNFLEEKNVISTNTPGTEENAAQASPELKAHYRAMASKMENMGKGQGLLAPSTGNEYDVKYYRLNLRINPDTAAGKYVRGNVTIYFTTTIPNFSVANFDMATALTADSVYYHGVKVTAGNISRPTDLIAITIPTIPATGTLDSLTIYYKGVPPVVPDFSGGTGYVRTTHRTEPTPAPLRNYVYTLSEPYSSYTWWPCKSFIVIDKADSADIIVSTPTTFKVAANGKLVSETVKGANNLETFWKERYAISAYQICLGVANYVQHPTVADTINLSGTKMPVFNYIFPETNTAAAQTALNRMVPMLTTYSSLYGDYPFKNEKYGNYTFGFGGGMEHNTFSGENVSVYNNTTDWDVLAHELAHQWWGASVTCASWKDIWINESFADFSEALLLEFNPTIASSVGTTAYTWRNMKKTNSVSATYQAKSIYATDTASITTIFTPAVYIYDRGGMVINMARLLLGDTKFFQSLQNIQTAKKANNAFTADIQSHMEAVSGLNLNTFFSNWIYNTGYASYPNNGTGTAWNNVGNRVVIRLNQTPVSSALSHFDLPLSVRIQGSNPTTMDTTVIIYDQGGVMHYVSNGVLQSTGSNMISYNLSFTPVTLTFDHLSRTLATGAFGAKNPALPTTILAADVITLSGVKNNDAVKLFWTVDNVNDYASFEIEKSADGINFDKIGTQKAADNAGNVNFTYTDNSPFAATAYYRVKAVQQDGRIVYTKIIAISNKNSSLYSVTPNPAKSFIVISSKVTHKAATVELYDASGKVVKKLSNQKIAAGSSITVAVNELGAGNYFVKISEPGIESYTTQIAVIR